MQESQGSKILLDQKAEKKNNLLRAAYELFVEKGVSKTSIDEIVKNANVAKGTFYLYFRDKTEIWEEVVVSISNQILTEAKQALEKENPPDMIDRILFVANYIIEYFRKNVAVLKMIQRNFSWPQVLKKMEEAQDNTLMQMLHQCFCSPYLSHYSIEEAYQTMFIIMEMVGSIGYTSIILEQPAPIQEMKTVLFRTIRKILM